ncbi:MAG: hypothetical protein AAGF26_09210 [Cyanobacteria bacterium P01_G01_bin.49]
MILPIQFQPIPRTANTAKISNNMSGIRPSGRNTTTWACVHGNTVVGEVTIWWGHTTGDAAWACNNWVAACLRGCTAVNAMYI